MISKTMAAVENAEKKVGAVAGKLVDSSLVAGGAGAVAGWWPDVETALGGVVLVTAALVGVARVIQIGVQIYRDQFVQNKLVQWGWLKSKEGEGQ